MRWPAPAACRCTAPRARSSRRRSWAARRASRCPTSSTPSSAGAASLDGMKHTELAELILDESGYTAMWQADKSPQAQSRLENLKELVRFMHEFETLESFLEHVSLVMDTEQGDDGDRVSLMTLHAAKGLEFDTVFLPGWEEGLFPHQRSLDESGEAGLEEERRLAYVGITRAPPPRQGFLRAEPAQRAASTSRRSRHASSMTCPRVDVDVVGGQEPVRRRLSELRQSVRDRRLWPQPVRQKPLRRGAELISRSKL